MSRVEVGNNSIGLTTLLFITFLVLKLTHVISWSWVWVTAPLWIPLAVTLAILIVVGFVAGLFYIGRNR